MTTTGDLWDDAADEYDSAPEHGLHDADTRAAWKDLLRTWLPPHAALVADLACGTGSLTVLVAELGHEVVGIDLSAAMVDRARAKAAPFGAAVRVEPGDVGDPALDPGSADVVLARHVLGTLTDPETALRRWVGLVRPGGRLLLVEGGWDGPTASDGAETPWHEGVSSGTLRGAVAPLVGRVDVVPLGDPVLWGREVGDERYLLVATR